MPMSWLLQAALLAAAAGPLSHYLIWCRYEFDGFFYKIVGAVLLLQPVALLNIKLSGQTWLQSYVALVSLETAYSASLFASIGLYRVFFHPLRRFPGPFWARLWMWWKIAKFAEAEKGYLVIDDLHKKYGDVVRIGMQSLTLRDQKLSLCLW